ncbi:hypothetical protein CU044_6043 [Streptomyces sp. L-9-10]|nr:hypothetical protein CU044_6043 [Streptomyces sp. L-9-10]
MRDTTEHVRAGRLRRAVERLPPLLALVDDGDRSPHSARRLLDVLATGPA